MNDDILKPLRDQIDMLDDEIIRLLGQRVQIVRQVAEMKYKNNLSVVRPQRMQLVLDRTEAIAKQHNIKPSVISDIYNTLIEYAHELEQNIIDKK